MKIRLCALLILLTFNVSYADGVVVDLLPTTSLEPNVGTLSSDQRWEIKRQVMSMPGVMFAMTNLTENGYVWTNDVIWEGAVRPTDEKWNIAGFFFQRPGYKGVWLHYAIQFDKTTRKLTAFKQWFGTGTFR